MPERDYLDLMIRCFPLFNGPKVIINYPRNQFLLSQIFGVPDFVVTWTYKSRLCRNFRLICWYDCSPDLSKVKLPYAEATLKDKRNQKKIKDGRSLRDVWDDIPQVLNTHPEKIFFGKYNCPQIPEELAFRIIKTTCNPGDLVFDPMCGTGTIPIVGDSMGLESIGIDLDLLAIEQAKKRKPSRDWSKYNVKSS